MKTIYVVGLSQQSGCWMWVGEFYTDAKLAYAEAERWREKEDPKRTQVFHLQLVDMDAIHERALDQFKFEMKVRERKAKTLLTL